MLLFNRKIRIKDSGIFEGITDWHSHILPGVDDGVRTIEESFKILSCYDTLGVKTVWFTPHVMAEMPNTAHELKDVYNRLCSAYKGSVKLLLASEHMLDSLFEKRLKSRDVIPLGSDGAWLLVETSYFNPPMGLKNILLRIKSTGIHPVLAHPERYRYMGMTEYMELKQLHVKFQLNLPSLTGAYGKDVREKAEAILKHGWYDIAGTDIHSYDFLQTFLNCRLNAKTIERIKYLSIL